MTDAESKDTKPEGAGWWQRRKIWQKVLIAVGGVVVLLAIAGAIFGEPKADVQPSDDSDATAEATTTVAGLPGVGDTVNDGKFAFVVTGVEQPGDVYSPGGVIKDESNGDWFVVFMTVENTAENEQTFFAGDQRLLWDGKEYGAETLTWHGTNGKDLNPGVSAEGVVLFDLPDGFPRNGEGTVLKLHDSAFSGGVELHL